MKHTKSTKKPECRRTCAHLLKKGWKIGRIKYNQSGEKQKRRKTMGMKECTLASSIIRTRSRYLTSSSKSSICSTSSIPRARLSRRDGRRWWKRCSPKSARTAISNRRSTRTGAGAHPSRRLYIRKLQLHRRWRLAYLHRLAHDDRPECHRRGRGASDSARAARKGVSVQHACAYRRKLLDRRGSCDNARSDDRGQQRYRRGQRRYEDIPANVVAYGSPCRVAREINEHDREFYYKDRRITKEIFDEIKNI